MISKMAIMFRQDQKKAQNSKNMPKQNIAAQKGRDIKVNWKTNSLKTQCLLLKHDFFYKLSNLLYFTDQISGICSAYKRPPLNFENGHLLESLTKHEKVARGKYSEHRK